MGRNLIQIVLQFGPLSIMSLLVSSMVLLVFLGRCFSAHSKMQEAGAASEIAYWIAVPGVLLAAVLNCLGKTIAESHAVGIDADRVRMYSSEDISVLTGIMVAFLLLMVLVREIARGRKKHS